MVLDEFAQQASRSIRVHHASFDCDVPCHCIALVDMVGWGSNIYLYFLKICILCTQLFFSIYVWLHILTVHIIMNLFHKSFLMVII